MNTFILSGILILLTVMQSMAQPGNTPAGNLEERLHSMQWQKRVLLLYAPDQNHTLYGQQKRLLEAKRQELEERDLVQIELLASEADAATKRFLEGELKATPGTFNLLLIGKDGGVKYRTITATPVEEIVGIIDAMPMRQSEMQKQQKRE